jgi:hypothetical protein
MRLPQSMGVGPISLGIFFFGSGGGRLHTLRQICRWGLHWAHRSDEPVGRRLARHGSRHAQQANYFHSWFSWFSITDEEQQLRFTMRIHDPLKQWKLSPMDVEARSRWEQYTKAKEAMLEQTHIPEAPWHV